MDAYLIDYSTDYFLIEGKGPITDNLGLTGGYEILGSDDGTKGFQTPLATGHKG